MDGLGLSGQKSSHFLEQVLDQWFCSVFVLGHKANSLQMENNVEALTEMIEFLCKFDLKLKFNSKLLKTDHQWVISYQT